MTTTNTTNDKTDNLTNTKLSISTLNINGLAEDKKRNKLSENLTNKKTDIILLQETHSTKKTIEKWEKEWTGKSFWNSGEKTKSSGVAILLRKNLDIEVLTIQKDDKGRILSLAFSFEKQNFQILNIYAPTKNSEKLKFYKKLKNYITINNNLILGGDFNMVEDILLDRQGGNPNNTHMLGLDYLKQIKQRNKLIDIWRKENPNKRLFTFHNHNQSIHSRIDRFYINKNQKTKDISIFPNNLSDHDGLKLIIQIEKSNSKGKGYWKLNTSIFKQKEFQKIFQNFWQDWQKEKIKYKSLNQWWESGKIYFKTLAIRFSIEKNQNINKKLTHLTNEILQEKNKINPEPNKIEQLQRSIDNIEHYKAQGTIIRSKERLIINEEKPTKYFYQQEKQKQAKKHIKELQNEKNKTLKTNLEILKECKNFYQKLYNKQKNCSETQKELLTNIPKLVQNNQNEKLIIPISKNELKEAIDQMENDKSPGIDGIPIEFYKIFYDQIEKDLLQIYNNILFTEKKPTKTMNQAIITLIPKKGNLNQLKYWRPISLLCLDYKILTKILANRLKQVLPNLISEEQNCSVPGRTIFNNLFLIRDAITLNKQKNTSFYILQVDQEKAFDKIDHDFLFKTMDKMGFSNIFINFIKILYKNNTSTIINNRYLSAPVQLQRGLRQGCPLSLPLYVVQGEVTTININQDESISGIKVPNKKQGIKVSQYPDFSNFLLTTQKSVENVIKFFQKLQKATGATINLDKTTILPINTDQTSYIKRHIPNISVKQQHQEIKILGITICESLKEAIQTNWQEIVQKMQNHINKLSP